MPVRPRNNNSPGEVVAEQIKDLQAAGWTDLQTEWDSELRVWRASGTFRNQTKEGRGSTQELSLESLRAITPSV